MRRLPINTHCCSSSPEALQIFIQDALDQTIVADMLDAESVGECKECLRILRQKNDEADSHVTGSKLALKTYAKQLE